MLDSKIYTFLKVVETESYTQAAEELHLTQPAVTQHIRKLEDHYQCSLIQFQGHQMRLTEEGKRLYDYANLQLNNEKTLIQYMQGAKDTMHIGATLSIADYFLPELLGKYWRAHPTHLEIRVGNTEEMLAACRAGQLDCAFIEGMFDTELFACHCFTTADFGGVVSTDHPLVQKKKGQKALKVKLPDLYEYPLILREKGSGTRAILENFLFQNHVSVESFATTMECGSFGIIKSILTQSDGVSFMYRKVAQQEVEEKQMIYLELEEGSIKRPLHFVYAKNSMRQREYEEFYREFVHGFTVLTKE